MIKLLESKRALYTLNGSLIARSKYGVGKCIGQRYYVHRDYATIIIPKELLQQAIGLIGDIEYNTLCYDPKTQYIRFDACLDFDTSREPCPGNQITINPNTNTIISRRNEIQIFHHKWLWVEDDYNGFDIEESYNWSKEWLKYISNPSGFPKIWKRQLEEAGLK